jgi:1-deoxy-D-xylulose-5-phosphate reductoisomerase
LATLTFEAADEGRFPCLRLAREAMSQGGGATAALNAANEVAVAAFLANRCKFGHIAAAVEVTLESLDKRGQLVEPRSLEAVFALDAVARSTAEGVLQRLGA